MTPTSGRKWIACLRIRRSSWDPAARTEFLEQIVYYEQQRPLLGQRFAVAVREVLRRLREYPESGSSWSPSSPDIRVSRLGRFPFKVISVVREDALIVLAIAHERQEPGYWRYRALAREPESPEDPSG